MNLRVKRSIFLSVAVLGFTVGAGVQHAQGTSAKTYAKIASNDKLTIPESSRNVSFTGKKALYTKVGTLKGARVVATKSTLRGLAISSDSRSNVRAYRVAVTSRGSVYYKVVTFDGMYRGWIYSGKSTGYFGGGLKRYSTFINQGMSALSADQQNAMYRIATPGTRNDGKSVTYKAPSWTQYKVGRAITDSSMYANTNFRINQVGIRTRENDQWVHIYDPNNVNSPATGWILLSGLSQVPTVNQVPDNAIRVNLVDASGKAVSSFDYPRVGGLKGAIFGTNVNGQWSLDSTDQSAVTTKIQSLLSGTDYNLAALTLSQITQLAQTTFGSTVTITVNLADKVADNAVRINLTTTDGKLIKSFDWVRNGATKGSVIGTLSDGEKSDITTKISSLLTNSTFSLAKSGLNATQIQSISTGVFGGQVNVVVNPTVVDQDVSSKIIPMSIASNDTDVKDAQALSPINADYDDTSVDLIVTKDGNEVSMSAADLHSSKVSDITDILKQLTNTNDKGKKALSKINDDFKNAAVKKFQSNLTAIDGFKGKSGAEFTKGDLSGYLIDNFNTLTSPLYPQLTSLGKGKGATVSYYYVTFSLDQSKVNAGKFGDETTVYYIMSAPQQQPKQPAQN